ncbi:molybdenum cofactor biosynthesis protein [Parafrankia soli]|uniref:Molybdenum cofactor biosynthesis protein n=1 Tax=Parafrankia soli TaxID=2599596 RepID=A0A1S1PE56_9ACTN|nr:NTP transferase domain-containing protein [Parafrankia soli]OHV21183.1 molybdenum cofactor biosynthesis protein [Parafrankia soli]
MTGHAPARIVAAVLAAGGGSRMGAPKAELVVGGARLVDRAVAAARDAGCRLIIAVVRDGTAVPGADVVVNPDPGRGQRSSLTLALDRARGLAPTADTAGVNAVAVLLVDTPGIGADAVRAVLAAWRPGRVAVGRYGGRRGHPIVMAPRLWREAIALAGADEGARRFLAAHPDLVDEVPVPGDPADLDTPEDVRRWPGSRPSAAGTAADAPS